jgi:hypothetical protein
MCAGLIADRTLLRNGLLVALGEFALGDLVVGLIGPVGKATHRRLPSLIDYTEPNPRNPITGIAGCRARARPL